MSSNLVRSSWIVLLLAIATAAAAFPSGLTAQTPAAEMCTLDPVTLPLFEATPAAVIAATPLASTTDAPVDDDEIRVAIEILVVCMNSGDAAYRYAIFTDRYLATQFTDPAQTYQPQFEEQLAQGPIEPEGDLRMLDIREITPLDNGSVSVIVELSSRVSTFRDTLILVNVDGAWLIDDVVILDPPQ